MAKIVAPVLLLKWPQRVAFGFTLKWPNILGLFLIAQKGARFGVTFRLKLPQIVVSGFTLKMGQKLGLLLDCKLQKNGPK